MELDFIRNLADIMKDTGLEELEYKEDTYSILLKKRASTIVDEAVDATNRKHIEKNNQEIVNEINFEKQNKYKVEEIEDGNTSEITSTMIGTFYMAPSPDEEAFVRVVDIVKKGQVVCIIESMKLMNEVRSPFDCEILELLVDNQDIVEFGQALFKVKEV